MSKHTPGPWHVSAEGEVKDDFGVTLAYLVGPGRNSEDDGRLIAAAPELLGALNEALIALAAAPDTLTTRIATRKVLAAIAKATGEAA